MNVPEDDEPGLALEHRVELGKGCLVTPAVVLETIEHHALVVPSENFPHVAERHDRELAESVPAEMIPDQHGPALATLGGVTERGHIGNNARDRDPIDPQVGTRERGSFLLELLPLLAAVNEHKRGDQRKDPDLGGKCAAHGSASDSVAWSDYARISEAQAPRAPRVAVGTLRRRAVAILRGLVVQSPSALSECWT